MSEKRYYWLKLKESFFGSKEIKKLRKIAGGDTYTIIYLKMQLLSIKNGGLIKYDGTEQNIAEQLSIELDESMENIKMTLSYLQANKLIEGLGEDEYLLNRVPELIGSETTAAERMRRMRGKRRAQVTSGVDVTTERNFVTHREERREKRIDSREKINYQKLFDEFWAKYPKKIGKKKSKEKFISLLKSKTDQTEMWREIMCGLEYQLDWREKAERHNNGGGKVFIPEWKNPLTWLRGECWSDVYDKIPELKKKKKETVLPEL